MFRFTKAVIRESFGLLRDLLEIPVWHFWGLRDAPAPLVRLFVGPLVGLTVFMLHPINLATGVIGYGLANYYAGMTLLSPLTFGLGINLLSPLAIGLGLNLLTGLAHSLVIRIKHSLERARIRQNATDGYGSYYSLKALTGSKYWDQEKCELAIGLGPVGNGLYYNFTAVNALVGSVDGSKLYNTYWLPEKVAGIRPRHF